MKRVRTPDGRSTHAVREEDHRHRRVVMKTYCGLKSAHDRLSFVHLDVDCASCLAAMKKDEESSDE